MARFRVEGPDGRSYTVEAPEGASDSDVMAFLQSQMTAPKPKPVDAVAEDAKTIPWYQAAAIGMGRGAQDVMQGVKQIQLQAAQSPFGAAISPIANLAKLIPGAPQKAGQMLKEQQATQALEAESFNKLSDASPIMATGGRILGNIMAAPIPAAKGATLGKTMLSGAGAGATAGAVQYVPEGGSRALNTGLGAVVGGLLPAGIEAGKLTVANVKLMASKLKAGMPNVSQAAREKLAAQIIRESAQDAGNLAKAANPQQFVAGTQQTLAEAADDAGLANLQRTLGNMDPQGFAPKVGAMAQQNNAARVDAIRGAFGGADEGSAQAIEAARNQATAPLLAAARKVKGVDTKPTVTLINRIIKSREGNDSVTGVLNGVKEIMERPGMDTVQKLHNVRQEIGNIMGGLSPNKEAGKAAMRELMAIKQSLDTQIGKSSPEFRQFLKQYADMSKEAGRVRMGDELLGKSGAILGADNNPVLSPAKFANAANDLDRVAKAATGFRKETADRLLSKDQKALIGNVRADLDRAARAQRGGLGHDSASVKNAAGLVRLQDQLMGGEVAASMLPPVANFPLKAFNELNRHYAGKTLNIVQEMMLSPQNAQRILARYPPQQRVQVMTLLDDPRFQEFMRFSQEATPAPAGAASAAMFGQPQEPPR